MDNELKEKLVANGFELNLTLQRFMGNEALYFRFLRKLPADQNFDALVEAVGKADCEAAFRSAHTLKGVLANLGINGVLEVLEPMVEDLRANNLEEVNEKLGEFRARYEKALAVIQEI